MTIRGRDATKAGRVALALVTLFATACAGDFETKRTSPPRASLGRELFGVACDRVGAQALRDDVTGASFHAVCHPDANGAYSEKVDVRALAPITSDARTPDGALVPVAQQQANRLHRIARIEALARRREPVVQALDAALPDVRMPATTVGGCSKSKGGAVSPLAANAAAETSFHVELKNTLSRIVDLYDDETIPSVTRALGQTLRDVQSAPDVQLALARFDARQGYRPLRVALGLARPVLAYPHLPSLARALFRPLVEPADGEVAKAFAQGLTVLHHELNTPSATVIASPLARGNDPKLGGRTVLGRPRTLLEAMREVLLEEGPSFRAGPPSYVVRRDARGYADVAADGGGFPAFFVDRTGPSGRPDGLADVDDLGRFITSAGPLPPSPFFAPGAPDGPRDTFGRATAGRLDALLYTYVDARQTFLAAAIRDAKRFFEPDATHEHEAAMNIVGALSVLAGTRDPAPTATRLYPTASDANPRGTAESVAYRAFHPEASPLVHLVHAVGQIVANPATDDLLALAARLSKEHPEALASLMGIGLEVKGIAARHPEADLPANQTFYDDLLAELGNVAREPGLLEDIIRAFADENSSGLERVLATFFEFKDETTYDRENLNGPSLNATLGGPVSFVTPVNRAAADSGTNRSAMQKFLGLLHDANGLAICTKAGAVVHIKTNVPGTILPVAFDYPTDRFYTPLVCGVVGEAAPTRLEKCQVFGFTNVMSLLLDVVLDKAHLEVRDPCLNKLMSSKLAEWAGGADHFLEDLSGVKGFSLHPNLRGFARLLYFETPYPGLPEDTNPKNAKTSLFLRDTIDPIPSMACPVAPFTSFDGTVFPVRACASVRDTLRSRDANALFPVDELGFVPALRPLAAAFDKHKKPLLFANLFDVLHLHWGSARQTKEECDPTAPRKDGRWCSQDGLVTYEPLVTDVLKSGIFGRLQEVVRALQATKVPHCTKFDSATHLCLESTEVDGVHVIGELLTLLFDADRSPGLSDPRGNTLALRNDGTRVDKITPMHLLIEAFKGMDRAFVAYASGHPEDADRQRLWRAARSELVDAFLAVDGKGAHARFTSGVLMDVLPRLLDVARAQIFAHCPPPGAACAWAQHDLAASLADTLRGPSFAAAVDLVDAVRRDDDARREIERLMSYLLDVGSENDAHAAALTALTDLLQVLEDDANLAPFKRLLAGVTAPDVRDADGAVVGRGLVDGGVRALARLFERTAPASPESCPSERDPNGAIALLLGKLVTPMGGAAVAPIETLVDVIADVNRVAPGDAKKLDARDYGNIASELGDFFLNGSSGLEQIYATLQTLTRDTGAR